MRGHEITLINLSFGQPVKIVYLLKKSVCIFRMCNFVKFYILTRNSLHKKSGSRNLTKWIGLSKRVMKNRLISRPNGPCLAFLWPYSESFHNDNAETAWSSQYITWYRVIDKVNRGHAQLEFSFHVQNIIAFKYIFFLKNFFSLNSEKYVFPCARTFTGL